MGFGRLLGAAAGYLLAPATGGASLALSAAGLGSALGGAAEEALGGGAAGAAKDAGAAANAGVQSQLDLQRRMYEEGVARQQPFYQAGVNALPGYLQGIGQGGELVRGFTMGDYQADPGYAFRLSEGQKALDRQAAARGGLISGGALKAAQRFGQDMASQEYSNAYNRFRDTQGLRRNAMAGVVGFAPTAANQMGASGQNYATGAGNAMATQGENSANALLAAQQARSSSYGQVGSALTKYLNNSGGLSGAQAAFSQTGLGGSGFGSGLAYGNEDLGQYF
jgi:hypothetical protein